MNLHDTAVDVLKRGAISLLHRTPEGEAFLLGVYLIGEEQSEQPFLTGDLGELPPGLAERAERHRRDEVRHAAALRARIQELTGAAPRALSLDPISRWKLRRLEALAAAEGLGHPWAAPYAVAWRAERMAVRILERHVRVLEAQPSPSATLPLLRRILADERAHVAMCRLALDELVPAERRPALDERVRRADAVDRAFGVLGACGLLFLGAWRCVKHQLGSSTSPSPTRAAT